MTAHRSKLTAAATALVAALAVAAFPARADAQFGGLLKKAKEKAAEKVAEKAVDKALGPDSGKAATSAGNAAGAAAPGGARRGRVLGGGSGVATGPAPTYTANLLEITPARLDQLTKGLDAERAALTGSAADDPAKKQYDADVRAYEAKKAAYDKKMADVNARMSVYATCVQSNAGPNGGTMTPGMQKMAEKVATMSPAEQKAFMSQMQAFATRAQAADKRGDKKTAMAIMDSAYMAMGLSADERRQAVAAAQQAQASNRKSCGEPPAEMSNPSLLPQEPQRPELGTNAATSERGAAQDRAAAKAAGLTVEQYGVLRERVAALVIYNGRPGPAWGFSENERKLVAERRNFFNKYEDLLGGTAISWRFVPSTH